MLRTIIHLADGLDVDGVADRRDDRRTDVRPSGTGPRSAGRDDRAAPVEGRQRRLLMVGGRTDRGSWTWVSPDLDAADRAVPGPWDLTLLLRGRPAGGSPP